MRVISGIYKGHNLISPKGDKIRPTTDRVKETLFNILYSKCAYGYVLDLFCGSGALGIEALSRGASECVFIDRDIESVKLTQSNLAKLKVNNYELINNDVFFALKTIAKSKKQFDIILVDPPYKDEFEMKILESIFCNAILSNNGIVVIESDSNTVIKTTSEDKYKIIDNRKIGKTSLNFFAYNT